jgi:hypothetical protein
MTPSFTDHFCQWFQVGLHLPQAEGGHRWVQFMPFNLLEDGYLLAERQRQPAGGPFGAFQAAQFLRSDQRRHGALTALDDKGLAGSFSSRYVGVYTLSDKNTL